MKKTLPIFIALLFTLQLFAQDSVATNWPNITVKWAPTGLFVGSASFQVEYNFGGRSSLTAKIGLPAKAHHTFTYDNNDADFNMKATSFLAGFRTYLSKKHLRGLYYEPFFKYVHHTGEGTGTGMLNNRPAIFDFTNDYNGIGVGVQMGAQFLVAKRWVIDLFFLGPEINSSTNSFKAMEVSNTVPWTYLDASETEKNIRDFVDQFPFIRNRTTILVDRDNKRASADFKGALPGLRAGVSIGFAF